MNIKKAKAIIDHINETVANWNNFANQVNVDLILRDAITATLLKY